MSSVSRRDFLKLMATLPASVITQPLSKMMPDGVKNKEHVIVIVYDAWAARNVSLYGYARPTMPHLEKFAQKATVFHQHYSTATFTVPGTGSLLTGVHPWTHRALSLGGRLAKTYQNKQVFNVLSAAYTTVGYAQNKYADFFLYEAEDILTNHIPNGAFNLSRQMAYSLPIFKNDAYIAFSSLDDNILQKGLGYDGSLFLGPLLRSLFLRNRLKDQIQHDGEYVDERLPDSTEQFLLKDVVNGAINILENLTEPSFVYIHFFPPHDPYRPTKEFENYFLNTDETLVNKPLHPLSTQKDGFGVLKNANRLYDEYLAAWDAETSRIYSYLDDSGLREKSHIIITSDHGEIFERGENGHFTPVMYRPLTHVPLIISSPNSTEKKDIYTPTSSVDILPTIAHLTGLPRPDWAEGELLPGFGGVEDSTRSIYSMDAKTNSSFAPLSKFSMSLTKGSARLLYYHYDSYKEFEFYNLAEDPEEMNNLFTKNPTLATQMKEELLQKIAEVNKPFEK